LPQSVEFSVRGRPISKGSMRSFAHKTTGKVITIHDNKRSRKWQRQIEKVAALHSPEPLNGAIEVHLTFVFERPKSAKNRLHPAVRPDLDKLLRAALDALTGIVYEDDARVVAISAEKIYVPEEGLIVEARQV